MIEKERFTVIDADRDFETIHQDIVNLISSKINAERNESELLWTDLGQRL